LQTWSALAEQVKAVIKDYPKLKLTQGRKVLEIRPNIMWDKGKALEFLLEALGTCLLFFQPLTDLSCTFIQVRVTAIVFLSVLFTCVRITPLS
jgi:hypothetical protein